MNAVLQEAAQIRAAKESQQSRAKALARLEFLANVADDVLTAEEVADGMETYAISAEQLQADLKVLESRRQQYTTALKYATDDECKAASSAYEQARKERDRIMAELDANLQALGWRYESLIRQRSAAASAKAMLSNCPWQGLSHGDETAFLS